MQNFTDHPNSELTGKIINAAYYVYNYFGFCFLESVYEKSLEIKLRELGFKVSRQQPIVVYFEGEIVGDFKADLVVNDTIIIELKAVESIHPVHEVQLVNYLRATEIEVGLVINFGAEIKIRRKR